MKGVAEKVGEANVVGGVEVRVSIEGKRNDKTKDGRILY